MQLFDESCNHFADVFPVRDVEGEILHPRPEHDGRSGGHDHRLGLRPQKWTFSGILWVIFCLHKTLSNVAKHHLTKSIILLIILL